jgi:hypothetical protein
MAHAGPSSAAILGGPLSPIGWRVGFIEAPLRTTLDRLSGWRGELGADLDVVDVPTWPRCLSALDPLEAPWTTELLVAHGGWTAYLNNGIDGGDPWPPTSHLGDLLGVRWVVADHQPPTMVGHAGTGLQLGGPGGVPPLGIQRTIDAHAEDGRWSWYEDGPVQPFERPDAYRVRRIRDRFPRPLLIEYLGALGIAVDEPTAFGPGILVRQRVAWSTRREGLDQARRSWGLS